MSQQQQQRNATVKVGLLAIVALLVLVSTVIWLRGRSLAGGQSYTVLFSDVDGLRDGAPVQFMGIRVGYVDQLTPVVKVVENTKKYLVGVTFTISESGIDIPKGSILTVEQVGLIGEKFIEVTPPRAHFSYMLLVDRDDLLSPGLPIKVAFKDDIVKVGVLTQAVMTKSLAGYQYNIEYRLNRAGYVPPDKPHFHVVHDGNEPYLLLMDSKASAMMTPAANAYFTVDDPIRFKVFIEQQLATAESMKMTNEKINELLSPGTIASIQGTLKNSEKLTEQATVVLAQAQQLFQAAGKDLNTLVNSTERLTNSVVAVTDNVNDIVKDPKLKRDLIKTVASVEQSSEALAELLRDPNLKLLMSDARVTSKNAAELMTYLKSSTIDNDMQGKLNESITLLNTSLKQMNAVLHDVEGATSDKNRIRSIIKNTDETTENLNKFSNKLNKHFLLFRLLF